MKQRKYLFIALMLLAPLLIAQSQEGGTTATFNPYGSGSSLSVDTTGAADGSGSLPVITPSLLYTMALQSWIAQGTYSISPALGGFDSTFWKIVSDNRFQFGSGNLLLDSNTTSFGTANAILAGAYGSSIGGGSSNYSGFGPYNVVAGGFRNYASYGYASVGGGNQNAANALYSTIPGGYNNLIHNGAQSATVWGESCSANNGARYSTVGGLQSSATLIGGTPYAAVALGKRCVVGDSSGVAFGSYNLASGPASTAFGTSCTASGRGSLAAGIDNIANAIGAVTLGNNNTNNDDYTFVFGYGNTANAHPASSFNAITGGQNNATGFKYNFIGGGASNYCGRDYRGQLNAIPGGYGNLVGSTEFPYVWHAVAMGKEALAYHNGAIAHATGNFASEGDAQKIELNMRNATADATPDTLYLDGNGIGVEPPNMSYAVVDTGATWTFTATVSARSDGGASASYIIHGTIENVAGTTAIIGTNTEAHSSEDDAAWDCSVVANDDLDCLVILVTGAESVNIRWHAIVNISQVQW